MGKAIKWTRVRGDEAATHGINRELSGWAGKSAVGLYFAWCQARPRDDGAQYASARVDADGYVENDWLCRFGTLSEAKQACEDDVKTRVGQ